MNKEEIQDILEELHLVRPEILQPKAKKLFEAIMSIADERDELKQENKQLKEQNEREFADYTKFKQEQYDEYLEKNNKLIKEKQHYKHIIDELEKWLKYEIYCNFDEKHTIAYQDSLNKLQELKGNK